MSFLIRPDNVFQLDGTVADTSVTRWAAKLVGHKAKTFFSYGVTKQMIYQDKAAIGPITFYRNYTSYVSGRISGEELVVKTAELLDVPSDRIDLQSVIHAAICVGRVIGYSAFSMIPYMATHPTVVSLLSACGVRFLLAAMSEIEGEDYKLYPGFPVQLIDRSVKDVTCAVFLVAVKNGYVRPQVPVREVSKAQRDNAVIVAHGVFKNELIRRTSALRSAGFTLTPVQQDMEALVAVRLADFLNKADDISCFFNRVEKEEYFDTTMYSIATVSDGKWSIDYIPMYFDEFTMKGYVEWPHVTDEQGFMSVDEMVGEAHTTGSSMLSGVESRSLPNAALVKGAKEFFTTESGFVVENRTDDVVADMAVDAARLVCECGDVDKRFSSSSSCSDVLPDAVCDEVITNAPLRKYHDTKHEVPTDDDDYEKTESTVTTPVVESQVKRHPAYIASIRPNVELSGRRIVVPPGARLDSTIKSMISMWNRTRPRVDDRDLLKSLSLRELRSLANEFVSVGVGDLGDYESHVVQYCGMRVEGTSRPVCWVCASSDSGTFVPLEEAKCKYAASGFQFCGRPYFLKKGLIGDPMLRSGSGVDFATHGFTCDRFGYDYDYTGSSYEPHGLVFNVAIDTGQLCSTEERPAIRNYGSALTKYYRQLDVRNNCPPIGGCDCPGVQFENIAHPFASAVVRIESRRKEYDGYERVTLGRGFVVGRFVITAAHVVADYRDIAVTCHARRWSGVKAYVVGKTIEKDIAVLAVFPSVFEPGGLRWCEKGNLPNKLEYICNEPMLSCVFGSAADVLRINSKYVLTCQSLAHGYSGSPLVTADGTVVAMYVGALVSPTGRQRAGLAVRINRSLISDLCEFI